MDTGDAILSNRRITHVGGTKVSRRATKFDQPAGELMYPQMIHVRDVAEKVDVNLHIKVSMNSNLQVKIKLFSSTPQ